ncbi:oligosaccharide flippase family protein [Halobellus captivus]|uniref:oligosaccharide flippase family protein n=1 Tax=Halobellus captivus TaxID=2592614 RepID=UPI0011A5B6C6|nr:polysaccharide biosynthesis C-terminal domain-containing protein [Halobellus captivus]
MVSKLRKGFIAVISSRIGGVLVALVLTPALVRLLGSSLYGEYAFLMSLAGLTLVVINAGIYDGMRKYIAENRSSPNWEESVFSFYVRLGIVLAISVFIIYSLLPKISLFQETMSSVPPLYYYLLGGLILTRQVSSILRSTLHGFHLEHIGEPLKVVKKILFAIIGLSLAYLGYGLRGVLLGEIIAGVIIILISLMVVRKHVNVFSVFSPTPSDFPYKNLIGFNSLTVVLSLLFMSLYHIDILLLKIYVPSDQIGYYKAALVVAEFLWFGPLALQVVLLNSTSTLWSNEKIDQISDLSSKITRYNLLFITLLAIGLGVLADSFIPIYYGKEFIPSIYPLILLLPGVIGYGIARPLIAIGQGKGDLLILIVATGTAAGINLVLNILFIPQFGMVGAAVSTSIGYFSMALFHIYASFRIGYNPITDLRLFQISTTAIVSSILIFVLDQILTSPIQSILLIPPVGLIIYFILSVKTGALDRTDIYNNIDNIPSPFREYFTYIVKNI